MTDLEKRVEQAILGALPFSDKAAEAAIDIVLEEAAMWHDEQIQARLDLGLANEFAEVIELHKRSAAAIRAMKGKGNG